MNNDSVKKFCILFVCQQCSCCSFFCSTKCFKMITRAPYPELMTLASSSTMKCKEMLFSVSVVHLFQKLISISWSWFMAKLYLYLWYGSEGSPVILDMISRFAEFWINGVILLLNQECLRFGFCLFIYFGSYISNRSESMAIYWQRHLFLYIDYLLVAYCDAGETEDSWQWYCLLEEWSK